VRRRPPKITKRIKRFGATLGLGAQKAKISKRDYAKSRPKSSAGIFGISADVGGPVQLRSNANTLADCTEITTPGDSTIRDGRQVQEKKKLFR
jgi:hypothetical protein